MKKYLCSDIHWHLRPCLTVMWLATRPYKREQICSMTARLCFNIYYETGSKTGSYSSNESTVGVSSAVNIPLIVSPRLANAP